MQILISIPAACFAADDEALKKKREELKKKLLEGKKISIGPSGNVTGPESSATLNVPKGKLAEDAEALKKKREELKKKLLQGKKISIAPTGNVTGPESATAIKIPTGKLAALKQWYEKDPSLLEAEKAAMGHAFPDFVLDKLDDGRLCWYGSLNIGLMGDNTWNVMAVYDNDHGFKSKEAMGMGGTVKIYLVEPDINDLISNLDWRPHHLLIDSNNQLYLCTTEAQYVKTGNEVTSAASTLAWAVKWLMCFELVLTGDMTTAEFDKPHGI